MFIINKLIKKIEPIIAKADGIWSIVLDDTTQNQQWKVNEHELHDAASIIKVPIMATIFTLADKGILSLNEKIEMQQKDQVGGSGVLQHLTQGNTYSILDLITLMIIQSDNTATNMLIDVAGIKSIQKMMEIIGMKKSTLNRKLMIKPAKFQGDNMITAEDVSIMLKKILQGKISITESCEKMINIMKNQQIHYLTKRFPQYDPNDKKTNTKWTFASKTGNVKGTKHDIGILYVNDKIMTISILSSHCDRETALETLSNIGEEIFQYLSQQ